MSYENGKLPRKALMQVQKSDSLGDPLLALDAGRAYRHLFIAFAKKHVALLIVDSNGAYRDYASQGDMHVHPGKYNLNPDSVVNLASAGNSSHGFGTAVDLLFDGSSHPTDHQVAICNEFGWHRQFGADDPNHFRHDGRTAVTGVSRADCLKYGLFVQHA